MRNNVMTRIALIITPIIVLLGFLSILLLACNKATLSLNGFGVDATGQVYVGRLYKIEVYQHGQKISELEIPHYRNWSFCIQPDSSVLLTDGSTIYTLKEDGSAQEQQKDTDGRLYRRLRQQKMIIGNDGNAYTIESPFLRTAIVNEEKEILYQVPLVDMFVKIAFGFAVIGILCVVPFLKESVIQGRPT